MAAAAPPAAHPPAAGPAAFDRMWADLRGIGRHPATGGYRRYAWTREDAALREWFRGQAAGRRMDVVTDRAGNLWAWRGDPDAAAAAGRPGLAVGSHLDSVPDGGAFDGPLGVVSGFAALDQLDADGVALGRPVAVACFSDEEGARFGVACGGSRILTGVLPAGRALGLTDASGTSMAEAMAAAGHDPARAGPDEEALRRVGAFVELHIEQGKALADPGHPAEGPVAVGSSIWPHGRWRLDLPGRADHAGTTRLADRKDAMMRLADVVHAARAAARRHGCVATVGKVDVQPNGVNAIASHVTAWLDCRGADPGAVRRVVAAVGHAAQAAAAEESWTPGTSFDPGLAGRLARLLGSDASPLPLLPTGAGHDAGILAAGGITAGMLYVRNPTGISHSPAEHAEPDDCHAGVGALAAVIRDLAGSPGHGGPP